MHAYVYIMQYVKCCKYYNMYIGIYLYAHVNIYYVNVRFVWAHTLTHKHTHWARLSGAVRVTRLWRRGDRCACGSVFILIKRNLRRRGARDTPCTRPGPRPLAMHFLSSRSLRLPPPARHRLSTSQSVTRTLSPGSHRRELFPPAPARPSPGGRPGDALHTHTHTRTVHTRAHECACMYGTKEKNAPWCTYRGKTTTGRAYASILYIYNVQQATAAICVHHANFFCLRFVVCRTQAIFACVISYIATGVRGKQKRKWKTYITYYTNIHKIAGVYYILCACTHKNPFGAAPPRCTI